MSQATDVVLAPGISGLTQRTELNDVLDAFLTGHSGAARPSYLTGKTGSWVKAVSATVHELYYFDGTDDILVGTVNFNTNTFIPAGQAAAFANAVVTKTANDTLVAADTGKVFASDATTASFTLTIDTTASLGASWYVLVQKTDATANTVTLDAAGTDTINGATTFVLAKQHDAVLIVKSTASTFLALSLPHRAALATLAGTETLTNKTLNQPNIVGTTTNDSAAAGSVGEYISSTVLAGAAVSLTGSTPKNITSISLTAGDWDVSGNVVYVPAATTSVGAAISWIGTTSAALPTLPNSGAYDQRVMTMQTGQVQAQTTGIRRISVASTTTVYLGGYLTFGVSTATAYGFIGARRVR